MYVHIFILSHRKNFRVINSLVTFLFSHNFCHKSVKVNFRNLQITVWKNVKFPLTKKLFRQINSLVTYLVKPLLSRSFAKNARERESRNFHTVLCRLLHYMNLLTEKKNS